MKTLSSSLDSKILARSENLQALTYLLTQNLPLECSGHFQVANIRHGTLVLVTESPVWTTRLRQLSAEILRLLRHHSHPMQHVEIKTRLQAMPVLEPRDINHSAVQRHLSQSASQLLETVSSSVEDEALKNALLKLSRRGKKQ